MSPPVELRDTIAEFRPQGESSLVEAVELVRRAIADCRERSIAKLLIDATGLSGISIPTLVDRFLAVEQWAQEAESMVIVVLIIQPQYIHPERFGVHVAAHFGLTSNVFSSEPEARSWLSSLAPSP